MDAGGYDKNPTYQIILVGLVPAVCSISPQLGNLDAVIWFPHNSWAMKKLPTSSSAYRCPKCDGIGKPFNLKSEIGSVVMHFQCVYCNHTWKITKPEPPKTAA